LFTRFSLTAAGAFVAPGHAAICADRGHPAKCDCVQTHTAPGSSPASPRFDALEIWNTAK
jgi:hypothetical protein